MIVVQCIEIVYYEVEVSHTEDEKEAIEWVKDNLPEYEKAVDSSFENFEIMPEEDKKNKGYF